jgi:protein phosphatase
LDNDRLAAAAQMNVRIFSAMQKGPRGKQEDCLLLGGKIIQEDAFESESEFEAEALLLAACDGLGGHDAGDRASHFVCRELQEKGLDLPAKSPTKNIPVLLREIQESSRRHLPDNCGTTLAGLLVAGRSVCAFNAGDSRIYKIDGSQAHYISHDHSVVQGLLDNFLILQETAHNHPYRNLIEFGIGPLFVDSWESHSVYVHAEDYHPPISFLLCSDGLSDQMTPGEIHRHLGPDPVKNGRALLSAVCSKGLVDNTSFIVVELN